MDEDLKELRDLIAIQAMNGILAQATLITAEKLADSAYRIADAMLKRRALP